MNARKKKGTQIFSGIIFAVAVWALGILLSGMFCFVENIELYPSGVLVLLFPLLFVGACVFASKYALKSGNKSFFVSSAVSLAFPMVVSVICLPLNLIYEFHIPVLSRIADISIAAFSIFAVSPVSVFVRLFSLSEETHIAVLLIILCTVVMISGLVSSAVIFKKSSKDVSNAEIPAKRNEQH